MMLDKFLRYFARSPSAKRDETRVRFEIDGKSVAVQSIQFDERAKMWTIHLAPLLQP